MDTVTPDHTPPRLADSRFPSQGFRRSFTAPTSSSRRPFVTGSPQTESSDVEVITTYGDAKIVKFGNKGRPGTGREGNAGSTGGLPWTSLTERTQAAGPLSIYRTKSSGVCFLHSGSFLLSIFPRSQCWCVDGESIFVMPMRDEYYRIELSVKSEEDRAAVEEFKAKIGTVLQYEKTPCPFERGFHVELPELPETPVRKKRIGDPNKKAKRWKLDRVWRPEGEEGSSDPRSDDSSGHSSETTQEAEDEEDDARSDAGVMRADSVLGDSPGARAAANRLTSDVPPTARRLRQTGKFPSNRSFTLPPMLHPESTSPLEVQVSEPTPTATRPETSTERAFDPETASLSSIDSFYSISDNKTHSRSLEPPGGSATPRQPGPAPREPETTIASSDQADLILPSRFSQDNALPSPPFSPGFPIPPAYLSAPTSASTAATVARPMSTTSRPPLRRTFSPLPHPSNLVMAPARGAIGAIVGSGIAGKLARGMMRLILGPPAGLVALMVRVAKRIVEGTAEWGIVDTRDIFGEVDDQVGGWKSDGEEEWAELFDDSVSHESDEEGKKTSVVRRTAGASSDGQDREGKAATSGTDVD